MKSLFALSMRNLRHHARSHLAVLGGVAVGAAVLCGALFVGDSLRGSLKARAERQVNGITAAYLGEKLLDSRLAAKLDGDVLPALMLKGTATVESESADLTGTARVTIIGLDAAGMATFGLPPLRDANAVASPQLAAKLGARITDKLRVSVQQYSSVPRSSLLGKRDADDLTTAFTVRLADIIGDTNPANDFALVPSTDTPLNLYVPLAFLQKRVKQENKVNALLAFNGDSKTFNDKLATVLTPADWGLRIPMGPFPTPRAKVDVESEQLILSPTVVDATLAAAKSLNARAEPTAVYLANWIRFDDKKRIPYSVVAALDVNAAAPLGPFVPEGVTLKDDEIILTDWPESPLKDVPVGSTITLDFFEPEVETRVTETSTKFKLAGRIPLDGVAMDQDLSPPFPGITDKLRIGDWNPPFPFDSNRIKPGDVNEKYWDKYKTTPKAYITRAAGEKLFKSRFGVTTSVRVAGTTPQDLNAALQKSLTPQQLGIQFEDTQAILAKASVGGTDFGGLFLGFSLFLIVAALVLVGLLVRLSVERRAKEIGTFLALGFLPKQIRNGLLTEIFFVALVGAAIGLGIAVLYTRGLLMVLADLWPDADVKSFLQPYYRTRSAYYGSFGALEMSLLASWLATRGLVKLPAPMLLRGRTEVVESSLKPRRKWMGVAIIATFLLGLGSLAAGIPQKNPDFRAMSFFGGGSLVFLAGLLAIRRWLRSDSAPMPKSLGTLGRRNAGRFLGRSTLTVFLIGSATFLLVAVESFRRKPSADFGDKDGGSGGFNLLAEADVPLFHPFNVDPGRGDFMDSLDKAWQRQPGTDTLETKRQNAKEILDRIETLIPLRRRSGDDASCLNLYQAGKPRLLGVPQELIDRGGFRFAETEAVTPEEKANPWLLLTKPRDDGAIPVFGEMNSVMWMLKKAVGDEIELPDENGVNKKFRIVGTLQDSPFQSELLLSDGPFRQLYPHDEGYAEFLIATRGDEASVAKLLETGLQSQGMLVTSTKDRVASYQAVISTYLTTFQLLGGLGLLLGVLGLAAVVLRGVWERQSEFALMRAVGYTPANVRTIVLTENLFLLMLGVGLGLVAAGVSVAPHVILSGQWPWKGVVALLMLVGVVGTAVVFMATARATRISILDGLRSE